VRLAHERVLKSWGRARDIVRDNADFYRIRDDVEDQLGRWQAGGRNASLLIPKGVALAEAQDIAKRYPGELAPETLAFVAASRRRANRGLMLTGAAAATFACVAVLAGWQWRVAEGERARAEHNFGAAKNAIDGLNGLIYSTAQGLQNMVGMRVDAVKSTLASVSATIDALDKDAPDDAQLKLSRAKMLANFVDAYLAAGAMQDAERAARDGLAAARRAVALAPDNAEAERALVTGLYKLGDTKLKAGDAVAALAAYQESLGAAKALAARDDSYAAQRVLWVATEKTGDAKFAAKDADGALASYQDGLALARALAKQERSSLEAKRDLSISLTKLAAALRAQGKFADALSAYDESLAIRGGLADENEGSPLARRDLALALNDIGATKLATGDPNGALDAYTTAAGIFRKLAKEDPSDARAQRDVAVALNNIGDLDLQKGDSENALKAYTESVGVLRPLVALDDANIPAKTELAGALAKLAGVTTGDADALYAEALAILEPLAAEAKLSPQQANWIDMIKSQRAALR
jgi:tetratricopeptide (TPR) repeat protein